MAPSIVHLPNGQTLTVQPVFGGLSFKSNELNTHHSVFPPGWTIILNSEDDEEDHMPPSASMVAHTHALHDENDPNMPKRHHHIHRFRKPSLHNDHLFISSISNPSSSDFKPSSSPTRSIAMMLWATLWWYFHQAEPEPGMLNTSSAATPAEGRPKGAWRVNINREGIFKGKHLLPKLERMGLIASEDSTVGLDPEDGVGNTGEGWTRMFVSRKSFWQLDPRIYLFTLSPTAASSPFPTISPGSSRPASPSRASGTTTPKQSLQSIPILESAHPPSAPPNPLSRHNTPPGPYSSSTSHLPTFYPPPPTQYTTTGGTRHAIRPKPPRQGETFYTRYIPSLNTYISFRVACLSPHPAVYRGPSSVPDSRVPRADHSLTTMSLDNRIAQNSPAALNDAELLEKWMNSPRVSHSWGEQGDVAHQTAFLQKNLTSRHAFPVIGCFDGEPFGYFEVYWVKEDGLGRLVNGVGEWDRGIHCLVGEEKYRGRVGVWLSALVHWCWLADMRTEGVWMEPRVDNLRLKQLCESVGFHKECEVAFPHKQSNVMKISRENWEAPVL